MREGELNEFAHRVRAPGGHDVVIRPPLLQHEPHRPNVITGVTPVAPGIQVAKAQLLAQAQLDARDAVADLARHELEAAAGRVVYPPLPNARVEGARRGRQIEQPAPILQRADGHHPIQ